MAPTSAAEERRSARIEHLARTATSLIQERGFDRVSVNDLAAVAGISVGGLYRYISEKADLLVMACEGIYGDLQERMVQAAEDQDDHAGKLRAAMRLYLEACAANRSQILLMYREYRHLPPAAQQRYIAREDAIAEVFDQLLRAGVAAGVFGAVDTTVAARNIVLLGHLPALKGWSLQQDESLDALTAAQLDFMLAAVGRPADG